jgi:anti-sigma factor RsiW
MSHGPATYEDEEGIMSDRDPIGTDADRALWTRLKASAPATGAARLTPVFDEELAAWLDGKLTPDAAARVEGRLAADPAMLSLALEAAAAVREAATPAPDRLVARAQALVGFEAERQVRPSRGPLAWFARWRRQLEVAVVAGAFLVVCVTGFSLGGGVQEAFASDGVEVGDFVPAPLTESEIGLFVDQGGQ